MMAGELNGKRVLVTVGSRSIFKKLALDLAAIGARVAVNYRQEAQAADAVVADVTKAGGEAFAVQADIGQADDVRRMFAEVETRFGGLDVLVNNAGLSRDVPFLEIREEDWDAVIATNLKGPFLCCQAAARMMTEKGDGTGRMINISAIPSLMGRPNAANYSASKGGVNALTRALAVELGPGITVNAIALGFFDSPLVRELFSAEQVAAVEGGLPSGRLGAFADVSDLVRYLASDASGFVTGQTISLDGGQGIRMP